MDLIAETKAWLQAPFTTQMDAVHVFLLTGLVIISAIMWKMVVNRLEQ
jgi:hypothetical protein